MSKKKTVTTRMGFEPTRAEHNGLAVHRLNHSATLSRLVINAKRSVLFDDSTNHLQCILTNSALTAQSNHFVAVLFSLSCTVYIGGFW